MACLYSPQQSVMSPELETFQNWIIILETRTSVTLNCLLKRFRGILRTFFSVPSTIVFSASSSCFSITSKSAFILAISSSILSIFVKLGFKLSNCVAIFGKMSFRMTLKNILDEVHYVLCVSDPYLFAWMSVSISENVEICSSMAAIWVTTWPCSSEMLTRV